VNDRKDEIENKVMTTVRNVQEDVEEIFEVVRKKGNLIIHGMP
jgi:hypothetical protein